MSVRVLVLSDSTVPAFVEDLLFVLLRCDSTPALPYLLSFAAGAMIYVVIEELIPESQQGGHGDLATIGTMAGFAIMMTLDVALG